VFLYGGFSAGNAAGINGAPGSRSVDFSHNTILEWNSGAALDTGDGWKFHHNRVQGINGIFSTFSDNFEITDNTFISSGPSGNLWKVGLVGPQRDFIFSRNTFNGFNGSGSPQIELGTVSRGRIEDNIFTGNTGGVIALHPIIVAGSTTTHAYAHGITIARNRFDGWNIGATVAEGSGAPIEIGFNRANTSATALNDMSGIRIEQNTNNAENTNSCLVFIENDRQAAAKMDETRTGIVISGNESYGTTQQTVCMGTSVAVFQDRATVWPATGAFPTYVPTAFGNMINGAPEFELPGEVVCAAAAGAVLVRPLIVATNRDLILSTGYTRCATAIDVADVQDCIDTAVDYYDCPSSGTNTSDVPGNCTNIGALAGTLGEWGAPGTFTSAAGGVLSLGHWLVAKLTVTTAGTNSSHQTCGRIN
jgi:hypothetical protein